MIRAGVRTALVAVALLLGHASRAEDDLSAGFGPAAVNRAAAANPSAPAPAPSAPAIATATATATASTATKSGFYVVLVGSHRAQQFPQLGRGDIESHVETLTAGLNAASADFVVFVPRVVQNPDGVTYPFQARIHNTTAEAKNV